MEEEEVIDEPLVSATPWPHPQGVGTRLNYGVDGEVLLSVPHRGADATGTAQVPRTRDGPRYYHDPTPRPLREDQYDPDIAEATDLPRITKGMGLIPRELLAGVIDDGTLTGQPMIEARKVMLKGYTLYDPNERTMLVHYSFQDDNHYLAFADESKLILNRIIMKTTKIDGTTISVPQGLEEIQKVEFTDYIQEVKREGGDDEIVVMLVRCRNAGYVVEVRPDRVAKLRFETKFSSGSSMAVSPSGDVGVVEANGSVKVFNQDFKLLAKGKLETDEVSGWRQVIFHQNQFFFGLRKALSMVEGKRVKTIAIFPTRVDRIVALKTAPHNSLIMITANELIWYIGRERVLSWELYFEMDNPDVLVVPDPKNDKVFTCWIKLEWTTIVYTLGFDDANRPVSLRDPYMIEDLPLHRAQLLAWHQLTPEIAVVYCYFRDRSISATLVSSTVNFPAPPPPPPEPKLPKDTGRILQHYDKIFNYFEEHPPPAIPRPQSLEAYAEVLINYADLPRPQPLTILEDIVPIPQTTNFDELRDMFAQLKQYFASKNLKVVTNPSEADSDPFAYYSQRYPDVSPENIPLMVSSLTKVINPEFMDDSQREFEQTLAEALPDVQEILLHWADVEPLQPKPDVQATVVPETTMPTIKLTQTQTQGRSQRDDTQDLAPPTQVAGTKRSKSSHQSQKKKKKKKKSGFA